MGDWTSFEKFLFIISIGYLVLSLFSALEIRDYKSIILKQNEIIKYMKHQDELQCKEIYELTQKGW